MTDDIYLDYNASTPIDPRVLAVLVEAHRRYYGNPSAVSHRVGQGAARALEDANASIRQDLCAKAYDLVFTSGATESLNIVLKGMRPNRLVMSAVEHKSATEIARSMGTTCEVERLAVDRGGKIVDGAVATALHRGATVVVVVLANSETGVIQPVRDIAAHAAAGGYGW